MNYNKKLKIFFYSLLATFVIGIATTVLLFVFLDNQSNYKIIFIFLFLLIFLTVMLLLKRKFDFYNFVRQYHNLIENGNDPIDKKLDIHSDSFNQTLSKNDYKIFRDFSSFKLFYKFENVFEKSNKTKAAIIVIQTNDHIKFEDPKIAQGINLFEDEFFKKEKFRHHIILQFKNVENFSKDNIASAQNISFHKPIKNHYVIQINVISSQKENQVYFANSATHNPNHYYTFATKEVEKLI